VLLDSNFSSVVESVHLREGREFESMREVVDAMRREEKLLTEALNFLLKLATSFLSSGSHFP